MELHEKLSNGMNVEWLTRCWDLPEIVKAEGLAHNPEKVVLLTLSDGSRRYLKRLPSLEVAQKEVEINKTLVGAQVRVARIQTNRDGGLWSIGSDAGDVYILTEELQGEIRTSVNALDALHYGRELGRLHLGLQSARDLASYMPTMDLKEQLSNWAMLRTKQASIGLDPDGLLNGLISEMIHDWFPMLESVMPIQPIHRDAHPGNMVWLADGEVGFLDFEISTIGLRSFDIGYFCTSQWIGVYQGSTELVEEWLDIVRSLLSGYGQISPLSVEEQRSLLYVMAAIQMIFIGFWYDQGKQEQWKMNVEALLALVRLRSRLEAIWKG